MPEQTTVKWRNCFLRGRELPAMRVPFKLNSKAEPKTAWSWGSVFTFLCEWPLDGKHSYLLQMNSTLGPSTPNQLCKWNDLCLIPGLTPGHLEFSKCQAHMNTQPKKTLGTGSLKSCIGEKHSVCSHGDSRVAPSFTCVALPFGDAA